MLSRWQSDNHPPLLIGGVPCPHRGFISVPRRKQRKDTPMFKSMIAAMTALSLTLATPVHAAGMNRDEVGKLVFGLAAIAAISTVVNSRNRASVTAPVVQVDDREGRYRENQRNNGRSDRWSDLNQRTNQRVIPRDCLREVETRFGTQRMFGRQCLERNYRQAATLPNRCAVRVYTNSGPREGFDPLCLREQGYTTNRRRN